MSLISSSIPNLINGVSQQPPSLRLPTQAELQENALSSVVEGLIKRPPTQHIAEIASLEGANDAFIHPIRDENNNTYYLVYTTMLRLFDENGVEQDLRYNVDEYGSVYYLYGLSNPREQLSAVTVADTTFILNKSKTVQTDADSVKPERKKEALVYVKQGDYKTRYTLRIRVGNDIFTRTIETMASTQDTPALVNNAEATIQTDRIADSLCFDKLPSDLYESGGSFRSTSFDEGTIEELWGNYSPAEEELSTGGAPSRINVVNTYGIKFSRYGNVIHLEATSNEAKWQDFDVQVFDSRGNQNIFVFKGTASDFKKLPPEGPEGFEIAVVGDSAKGQDDYYVKLTTDESGSKVWKETLKQGLETNFNAVTMPHKVVGPYTDSDGGQYWEFNAVDWKPRKVGDDDTNPFPSFVGNKLNDIFFHRNRLGFLSDENVIFSEAGEFENFNFFLKTTLTLLDTDVIDVSVANNRVSLLRHAVPFNESLLLFSDLTQFKLDGSDLLAPSTVRIDVTTQFEADLKTRPVGAGKNVFFATKRGEFSGIREYFVDDQTETNDAADITSHCPNYLKGQVRHLAASSNEDMLIALTEDDPNAMYVYRYYWNGNEKLQSSWSRWTFTGRVLNAEFNVSNIEVLIQYGDKVCLERISLSEDETKAWTDGNHEIHLDRRVKLTSLSQPFPYTYDNLEALTYVNKKGASISRTQAQIYLYNNEEVYCGIPYEFRYVFSEFVMKSDKLPITTGRLQIRNLSVVYDDTGYFEAVVEPHLRTPKVTIFNGRKLDASTNLIGQATIDTGTFRFGVLGSSTDTKIELRSDSFLPCRFQSAEWEGYFKMRSQRM